jgi:ABC-type multidrug transport system permease subunit
MKTIFALARKDLKLLLRDKMGFFFTFFFPLIYAVFFGAIFSGQGGENTGMQIAVVDLDKTDRSNEFVDELDASDELIVTRTDREQAVTLVRTGKRVAFIVLNEGFGEAIDRMFWGEPAHIELGIDPARKAESGMLEGVLMAHAFSGLQDAFSDPTVMQKKARQFLDQLSADDSIGIVERAALSTFFTSLDLFAGQIGQFNAPSAADTNTGEEATATENRTVGWQPVVIESASVTRQFEGPQPDNAYEISFPQATIWGVLGCAAAFGLSIVVERTHGTLVRLRTAPITPSQILAGKGLACFVTTTCMVWLLTLVGVLFFSITPDSYPLLAMAFVSVAIAFVGIMMFLSVLGDTEQSAGGAGWAVLIVMAMFGGGMIPLFFMPDWMQTLSHISPVKWSILAMEGAVWRGFSFTEMLTPCIILVAIGAVFFFIGTRASKWVSAN